MEKQLIYVLNPQQPDLELSFDEAKEAISNQDVNITCRVPMLFNRKPFSTIGEASPGHISTFLMYQKPLCIYAYLIATHLMKFGADVDNNDIAEVDIPRDSLELIGMFYLSNLEQVLYINPELNILVYNNITRDGEPVRLNKAEQFTKDICSRAQVSEERLVEIKTYYLKQNLKKTIFALKNQEIASDISVHFVDEGTVRDGPR